MTGHGSIEQLNDKPLGVFVYPLPRRVPLDAIDVTWPDELIDRGIKVPVTDPVVTDFETFEDVFQGIFDEAFDLLVAKQKSYGPKNVEELGFYGVFSRLASDKVERLRNSLSGRVVSGRVVLDFTETLSDESLEDTILDLINYGAILLCLKRGLWGRPLAQDTQR